MESLRVRALVAAFAVGLVLAAGQRASADFTSPITLSYAGDTKTSTISVSLGGSMLTNVEPGPYFFNIVPPPGGGGSPISTFCIDLGKGVLTSGAPVQYNILGLTSYTNSQGNTISQGVANAITALYGFYYQPAWASSGGSNIPSTNVPMADAFQLALWELIYDGASDIMNPGATNFFSTGQFQAATSTAEQEALVMLCNVLKNTSQGMTDFTEDLPGNTLVALQNSSYQDQIWLEPTPKVVTGVPAPPGLLLAGFGFVALLGRARWNRRTPAAA